MDEHREPLTARRPLLAGGVALVVVLVAVAVATGSAAAWVVAPLVAAAGAAAAAVVLARAPGPPRPSTPSVDAPATVPDPVVPTAPVREVDDLRSFFDAPPGSTAAGPPATGDDAPNPPATPPTAPAPGPAAPTGGAILAHASTAERGWTSGPVLALATAAVLLVGAAGAVAVLTPGGREGGRDQHRDRPGHASTGTGTSRTDPAPTAAASTSPPLTAAAAGDLATASPGPGDDGFAARLAFVGVVLEPRAVGSTVSRPEVTVSSDGSTAVAHLVLPTWNCITPTAPADPATAGCTPGLTEYADLPTPDLQLREEDGGIELTGTFATYTRPNGSAPVYTGRNYLISVAAAPDGDTDDRSAPATGELQLGGATVATTSDRTANVVEFSD